MLTLPSTLFVILARKLITNRMVRTTFERKSISILFFLCSFSLRRYNLNFVQVISLSRFLFNGSHSTDQFNTCGLNWTWEHRTHNCVNSLHTVLDSGHMVNTVFIFILVALAFSCVRFRIDLFSCYRLKSLRLLCGSAWHTLCFHSWWWRRYTTKL